MTEQRLQKIKKVLLNRQAHLGVVTENVHDPHNIFACMRTCDSVGIQEVHIIQTEMKTRKGWGSKSSSSANKWLSIHQYDNVEKCFEVLKKTYDVVYATHLNAEAVSLYEVDFTQKIAVVFGNEKDGLSDEVLQKCDGNFVIPQVGMISSLNISVACAITVYEAYRQRLAAGFYEKQNINTQQYEALLKKWTTSKYAKETPKDL